jgi:hypothetical protein
LRVELLRKLAMSLNGWKTFVREVAMCDIGGWYLVRKRSGSPTDPLKKRSCSERSSWNGRLLKKSGFETLFFGSAHCRRVRPPRSPE